MSYKRKPNYHFASKTETGLDNVPLGRVVVCEDYDGATKIFVLSDKTGVTGSTTIEEAFGSGNLEIDKITVDTTPTDGSTNAITSNAVFDEVTTINSSLSSKVGNLSVQALHADALRITGSTVYLHKADGTSENVTIPSTASAYDAAHSFATNGYQKFSNGLIIQWYNVTADGTYNWPIAFPSACYSASATLKGVGGTATNTHNGVTATATQFTATTGVDSTNAQFIIGIGV